MPSNREWLEGRVSDFWAKVGPEPTEAPEIHQVAFWKALKELQRDISDVIGALEAEIYDSMGTKEVNYDGLGLVTRYKTTSNQWDRYEVLRRLKALRTDENGEYDAARVLDDLMQSAQIAYFRQKDLPFKVDDEVLTKTYGAKKIRLED